VPIEQPRLPSFGGHSRLRASRRPVPNAGKARRTVPTWSASGTACACIERAEGSGRTTSPHWPELDRTYISRIERGQHSVSILSLARIGRTLGVHPGELLP